MICIKCHVTIYSILFTKYLNFWVKIKNKHEVISCCIWSQSDFEMISCKAIDFRLKESYFAMPLAFPCRWASCSRSDSCINLPPISLKNIISILFKPSLEVARESASCMLSAWKTFSVESLIPSWKLKSKMNCKDEVEKRFFRIFSEFPTCRNGSALTVLYGSAICKKLVMGQLLHFIMYL